MRVKFGEWAPDQPCFEHYGLERCENTIPSEQGHYEPWHDLTLLTDAIIDPSTSLTATVASAAAFRGADGIGYLFAATKTNLYKQSASGWASVDRTASYSANTSDGNNVKWSFTQFGDTIYASNGNNTMQYYSINSSAGASTQFLDMSASSSAPEAKYTCVVRDHMFAANINGAENVVQFSRINNPTRWTPAVRYQADFQTIPNGGYIQGITGGDFAAILMEDSVYRASYVGSPLVYRFDEVAPGIGCLAPYSVTRFQNLTFFYSRSGFYAFDGQQALPIGDNKVDDFFATDVDNGSFDTMSATIDPVNKLYILTYASTASTEGTPNRCLVYNWATQRWTYIKQGYRALFAAYTVGESLDSTLMQSLNIDTMTVSLDSAQWKGGSKYFGGFNGNSRLGSFIGDALKARFETGCWQITPDSRSFMTGVRPMIELINTADDVVAATPEGTGDITATIGIRDRIQDAITFQAASQINFNGECPVRASSRYHRVRIEVSGGFTHATGFDFYARREGLR